MLKFDIKIYAKILQKSHFQAKQLHVTDWLNSLNNLTPRNIFSQAPPAVLKATNVAI